MRSISKLVVKSEIEMRKLGYSLSNLFQSQDLITFTGDLGVGKTFLCKSIIYKLTRFTEIPSPTFNIVHTYYFKNDIEICHCDFYRIDSFNEVEEIGVFEDLKKKLFFSNGQNLQKKFHNLIR
jgi:tRNA threonylcarbamoyladenosine biosynthesis protein TsaE